ncbi:flagellar basal body P-ring formation chaperone FlgA [Porticoccus sp. W117]|uniref:flagellar basal body P-ring formation chaperone FlgA n=1 Tax=Porticoccus sp. W117 TaxID=3054777 RepID=UPI00259AD86E|nr:flagellar basal body P-ring formation chaperone FlgA [Porticoccus sp. W117]MDM3871026.1 flagellar basal body P-ring formation chaperone FlgA [Porticoccus sp. W117]
MFKRHLPLLILLCSSALSPQIASAAEKQTPQSIQNAVKEYLLQQPQIQRLSSANVAPGRLDKRLKLERCGQPLQVFLPPGGKLIGKSTVGVRCTAPTPWTLYVPVTVTAYAAVATANHPLQRGALLTYEDFSMVQQPLHQVPAGYLENNEELIGKELTRTVAAGKTLTRNMLKSPTLIKRGQQVTLIAQQRNFEVRMNGKALANGAAGDRIRVQNLSSKKVVEGTIDAQGAVVVD